jgi:hypothetical protein
VTRVPDPQPLHPRPDARALLLEALQGGAPLLGMRVMSRLRQATTKNDLIEIVWQTERLLGSSRRPTPAQLCLQQARELLGLGNTMFTDETEPGGLE